MSRLIRASEIGEYVFCHRAWWLHVVEGYTSDNQARLKMGSHAHERHGVRVVAARMLLIVGCVLLAVSVVGLLLGR